MAVVDDSKARRQRSKDPKREGLEILAHLTTGKKHDYPACAVYRGGKCTCDQPEDFAAFKAAAASQAKEQSNG